MSTVLDLHIHSKYSRACSQKLTLPNIDKTCRQKGVGVISTGDFTHPEWFAHIKENLEEVDNSGLFKLKGSDGKVRFILGTEISTIYKKGDKTRRIHTCFFAPSLEVVEKVNNWLDENGYNIKSDGRPILGMDIIDLAKLFWKFDKRCLVIPAHIWTPWYAMFGSKSGFDSIEEAWGDVADKIKAIETGLSSDPPMNWRLSALDNITLVSNSDAHSLKNIAREANVFAHNVEDLTYDEIKRVIEEKDKDKFLYTIEFYPEEGRYHYDGHRKCEVSFPPKLSKENNLLCPVCKKKLVLGVSYRVDDLADRELGFKPKSAIPYKHLIELDKIIADSVGIKSRKSKKVMSYYNNILRYAKNELDVLLNEKIDNIAKWSTPLIAEGVKRVRNGEVKVIPGYDGEYGKIEIFTAEEIKGGKQKTLL